MKLLVTGGYGFIGSNFILKLLEEHEDFEITNVDAEFGGSNPKNLLQISNHKNYEFVKGNITNKKLMENLITKSDVVINFAAESFVDKSINDANPFLSSNILGAYTILDIIRKQNKKMIQISTDEVFGSIENGTAIEESNFNPTNPYAATKASAELLVNSYFTTYNSNVIVTRCTNNYGPRQFPEKLIPKTILLAEQNKKIPIYGNGKNIRDWIFVNDHCNAIINILKNGKIGNSYNISAGNEIDNITIVKKILSLMNKSEDLIEFVEDRPGHDLRYSMSSQKIKKEMNWNTTVNFEEGLETTVNWYLSNREWWKNIAKNSLNSTPWKN
jgi:dTDP-glucose 4,6-dehydratase